MTCNYNFIAALLLGWDGCSYLVTADEELRMAVYTLPDLPYDYSALEPAMTGEIMELHHDKHHAAYVKGANDTLEQLAEAGESASPVATVGLEKTLAFNLSGHVLHSIFWQNLSPEAGGRPAGPLADAISEYFGSFEAFRKRLSTATTGVQGSGWGVLGYEPLAGRLIIEQTYDHHGNVGVGSVPLLVFDAWEHAYYLQYRNVRPDYVTRLWDLVNWADVSSRFQAAASARSAGVPQAG
jgi:Fe-Mn family superoxide dismutase